MLSPHCILRMIESKWNRGKQNKKFLAIFVFVVVNNDDVVIKCANKNSFALFLPKQLSYSAQESSTPRLIQLLPGRRYMTVLCPGLLYVVIVSNITSLD